MLRQLRADMQQAFRSLRRQAGLTFTALFSLTLGIGITTGTFTLLNAMILRPIPGVEAQDRVLMLGLSLPERGGYTPPWWLSYPDYAVIARSPSAFASVAAAAAADAAIEVEGVPQLARGELVTPEYFALLGTRPVRGRLLSAADQEAAAVVVISHEFWQRLLGGDEAVVGRTLAINGHAFTVIGVAPPGFHGMTPADALAAPEQQRAFWLPIGALGRVHPPGIGDRPLQDPADRWLRVIGRVRPGIDLAAARASTGPLAAALAAAYPQEREGARLVPGDLMFGPGAHVARGGIMIAAFLLVPLIVLLIACLNVAGLLLASGATRQRELAIRASLGANRVHLIWLLLRESLLLALTAGALSLVVALWTRQIAAAFSIRPVGDVPLDGHVLLFALGTALLTGLAFGLLPALRAARVQPAAVMAGGAASEAAGALRLRGALVAAQLALTFILLVTCTLFVRSMGRGMRVASGFAESELLLVSVNLELLGVSPAQGRAIYARIEEEARSIPGMHAVGSAGDLPLRGARAVRVSAGADAEFGYPARAEVVGPGYFQAAGVDLVAGSGFTAADRDASSSRAVVNRALASRLWPGESALGRTLRLGDAGHAIDLTIIGIAEDARNSLQEAPAPLLYLPLESAYSPYRTFFFRTSGDPARAVPAVRAALRSADERLPLVGLSTMQDLRRETLLPYRLMSAGLGTLGALALLLAAVGLYGLISYNVVRRTREIGVRVALGASRREIGRWVLRGSVRAVLLGLGLGAPMAAAIAFAIRNSLFGVAPLDPVSFGGITLLLLLVAVLGSLVPAWRAAGIQPTLAIRSE